MAKPKLRLLKGLKVKHPKRHPNRKAKRGLNQTKRTSKFLLRKGGKFAERNAGNIDDLAGNPGIDKQIRAGGNMARDVGRRKKKKSKKTQCS